MKKMTLINVTTVLVKISQKGTISGYGTGDGLRCQSTVEISKI